MAILLKVCRNLKGRDLVVGDVHGHLSQLDRQLKALQFDPGADRLFFLGDVVDRGPDSESILAMIDQRIYFSVLGNHEAMMIAGYEEKERANLHRSNGGGWFYRMPAERQAQYVDRARSWPWAIEIDTGHRRVGLVHANVPDSSWTEVARQLKSMDQYWQSGASLSNHAVERAAQNLLWNRSLVLRLYSDVLESEENRRQVAGYMQSYLEGEEWIPRASPEQLQPFQVSGIDDVYMGHTYVPTAVQVGKCHFLDTYREEPGEVLSIVCVNAHTQSGSGRQ